MVRIAGLFHPPGNKLLWISINFSPKTSHSCLKQWYTRFSRQLLNRVASAEIPLGVTMSHEQSNMDLFNLYEVPPMNLALSTSWHRALFQVLQYLVMLKPPNNQWQVVKSLFQGIPPSQQNWLYFRVFHVASQVNTSNITFIIHARGFISFRLFGQSGLVPLAILQDGAGPRRYFPTLKNHDLRFSWLSLFCS